MIDQDAPPGERAVPRSSITEIFPGCVYRYDTSDHRVKTNALMNSVARHHSFEAIVQELRMHGIREEPFGTCLGILDGDTSAMQRAALACLEDTLIYFSLSAANIGHGADQRVAAFKDFFGYFNRRGFHPHNLGYRSLNFSNPLVTLGSVFAGKNLFREFERTLDGSQMNPYFIYETPIDVEIAVRERIWNSTENMPVSLDICRLLAGRELTDLHPDPGRLFSADELRDHNAPLPYKKRLSWVAGLVNPTYDALFKFFKEGDFSGIREHGFSTLDYSNVIAHWYDVLLSQYKLLGGRCNFFWSDTWFSDEFRGGCKRPVKFSPLSDWRSQGNAIDTKAGIRTGLWPVFGPGTGLIPYSVSPASLMLYACGFLEDEKPDLLEDDMFAAVWDMRWDKAEEVLDSMLRGGNSADACQDDREKIAETEVAIRYLAWCVDSLPELRYLGMMTNVARAERRQRQFLDVMQDARRGKKISVEECATNEEDTKTVRNARRNLAQDYLLGALCWDRDKSKFRISPNLGTNRGARAIVDVLGAGFRSEGVYRIGVGLNQEDGKTGTFVLRDQPEDCLALSTNSRITKGDFEAEASRVINDFGGRAVHMYERHFRHILMQDLGDMTLTNYEQRYGKKRCSEMHHDRAEQMAICHLAIGRMPDFEDRWASKFNMNIRLELLFHGIDHGLDIGDLNDESNVRRHLEDVPFYTYRIMKVFDFYDNRFIEANEYVNQALDDLSRGSNSAFVVDLSNENCIVLDKQDREGHETWTIDLNFGYTGNRWIDIMLGRVHRRHEYMQEELDDEARTYLRKWNEHESLDETEFFNGQSVSGYYVFCFWAGLELNRAEACSNRKQKRNHVEAAERNLEIGLGHLDAFYSEQFRDGMPDEIKQSYECVKEKISAVFEERKNRIAA